MISSQLKNVYTIFLLTMVFKASILLTQLHAWNIKDAAVTGVIQDNSGCMS